MTLAVFMRLQRAQVQLKGRELYGFYAPHATSTQENYARN